MDKLKRSKSLSAPGRTWWDSTVYKEAESSLACEAGTGAHTWIFSSQDCVEGTKSISVEVSPKNRRRAAARVLGAAIGSPWQAISRNWLDAGSFYATSDRASQHSEADEVTRATNEIFVAMCSVKDDDLDSGYRLDVVAGVLDRHLEDGLSMGGAIARVLLCSTESLSDEVRSAAVRYLALPNVAVPLSSRNKLFVSLLESHSEEQRLAAIRSLEEVGDHGVISSLRAYESRAKSERIRAEIGRAVETIESAHGVAKNTAA